MRIRSLVLAALIAAVPSALGAQPSVQSAGRALSAPDRESLRRAARRAQRGFESLRRANLPNLGPPPAHPCDIQVGRFCYWYDELSPPPPPEPETIGRARNRLVATLDSLATLAPDDEWIAGQRVRYLVEATRWDDAVATAQRCGTTPWWCAALAGLALHARGDVAPADSAFDAALRAMPAEERCRWTELSPLLDGRMRELSKRQRCDAGAAGAARDAFAARLWWLAQPFHLLPGNDLRAEHLARRTMARIESMAASGYDSPFGRDTEELMLRYGWPTAFTRQVGNTPGSGATTVITGHEPTPSFDFMPSGRLADSGIGVAREGDWELRRRLAVTRYAPRYLRALVPLAAQLALFRRGDSALVVAGVRVPASDSLVNDDSLVVGLVVTHAVGAPPAIAVRRGRWRGGALAAHAGRVPALASVELLAPARRAGGRVRAGISLPAADGRVALSSLLFYAPDSGTPASVEEALPRVLGEARSPADRRVGVLWETYGLAAAGEPVSVTLTVERVGIGWAERAAQRVGLKSRARPLDVRWIESPDRRSGVAFRALAVDLSHMAAGRYLVRLTVTARDGARAVSARELQLDDR